MGRVIDFKNTLILPTTTQVRVEGGDFGYVIE